METQYDEIEIFKKCLSTFKETSIDKDSDDVRYMTESQVQVVNYDNVKNKYIHGMKLKQTPCSNDALYIDSAGKYYFVEFKNGKMTQSKIYNVYNKVYDSLLIFNDIIEKNISFCRENVNFILVYNESKNPEDKTKPQESARVSIGKYFAKKANKKYVRFEMDRFEKIYFKDVWTYTEKEFEEEFLQKLS